MAKETVAFLGHIDYAHLREFELKIVMDYEISPKHFYLKKGGLIQKPNKSKLITELKSMIIHQSLEHAFLSHLIEWIFFFMCTKKNSIKAREQRRRTAVKGAETIILGFYHSL